MSSAVDLRSHPFPPDGRATATSSTPSRRAKRAKPTADLAATLDCGFAVARPKVDSPFGAGLTQPGGAAQMTQTLVELIYDRWPVFADYKALLFRQQLLLCIGQY